MTCDRRTFATGLASLALCTAFPRAGRAQRLEKPSIRLGVANKSHLYYLPVTLAERRGYFKDTDSMSRSSISKVGRNRSMRCWAGRSIW